MESIQQTAKRMTQRMDQLANKLGELRKETMGHHEQVMKHSALQSTRIELVENSLSAREKQIERLELQTNAHFAPVDARMNANLDAVSTLVGRVSALDSVVQTLEVEALRPAKSRRNMLALLRQWKERFSTVMRQRPKNASNPNADQTPVNGLIEIQRQR